MPGDNLAYALDEAFRLLLAILLAMPSWSKSPRRYEIYTLASPQLASVPPSLNYTGKTKHSKDDFVLRNAWTSFARVLLPH